MKNKGFTLVEILIVVVILGILAAIVIPQFTDASTQSKVSSCKSSLKSMRGQIELYKIHHGVYPNLTNGSLPQLLSKTDAAAAKTMAEKLTEFDKKVAACPETANDASQLDQDIF